MTTLFAAFAIAWLAFFAYDVYLVRCLARLEREAARLEGFLMEERDRGRSK